MDNSLLDVIAPLAALQNLPVHPDTEAILHRLQPVLENYTELEFRHDAKRIDLITLSDKPAEVAAFLEVLTLRGFSREELAVMVDLMDFGAGKVNGMKLPVAGQVRSGELYLRGAIDLDEAFYFLGKYGVPDTTLNQIGQMAEVFEKSHLHMLAVDAGLPLQFSLFLTTYLTPADRTTDWKQIAAACAIAGIPPEAVHPCTALHRLLSAGRPATLFFSFGVVNSQIVPRIKLDYMDVRLGSMNELLKVSGFAAQVPVLSSWYKTLRCNFANYAGVILDPSGIQGVRAYFTMNREP
jgi:hypothetical protein